MCITFMHYFKPKSSSVKDICPGINNVSIAINNRLIKVKTIQVKCHRRHTKSGKPNANNRPSPKEKVETTAVVKASVLKN